jgi:putative DNA primase/helicase
VRAFLQRLIGYALVGNQTEAVFPVLYGKGANGKSTFVDILAELFGSYSCVAEKSLFKAVRSDGHPADRAVLINKRLARSEELPDVELDEPKIKGLTGGDKISGRGMRENFREWAPTHTFLVHSNTKPRLSGTDDGIWRRVILVPFNVRISTEEADPYLKPKLLAELSGILNWALRGYEAYCERGLAVPEVLRAAVAEYRADAIKEAEDLRAMAVEKGQVAAATQAASLKAKLAGHLIDRKEIKSGPLEDTDVEDLEALLAELKRRKAAEAGGKVEQDEGNRPEIRAH